MLIFIVLAILFLAALLLNRAYRALPMPELRRRARGRQDKQAMAIYKAASYGEGFRSLDATANVATSSGISGEGPSIQDGSKPFSKVRSYEAGFRARTPHERFTATISAV